MLSLLNTVPAKTITVTTSSEKNAAMLCYDVVDTDVPRTVQWYGFRETFLSWATCILTSMTFWGGLDSLSTWLAVLQ